MDLSSLTWIEVSQQTLLNNVESIRRKLAPNTKIMAMVKANAYGHDLDLIAPFFSPRVDFFGVNTFTEAKTIRILKIDTPILITAPVVHSDIAAALKQNFSLSVYSIAYLKQLQNLPAKIHLKINTGMNRLGIDPTEFEEALAIIQKSKLKLEGLYTHFHSADNRNTYTPHQFDIFNAIVKKVKTSYPKIIAHCANSGAILNYPETHLDMVRPGISLYRNALSWKASIVQSRKLKPHDIVGYSATFIAKTFLYESILPVGYSDGLDRGLSNKSPFLGRISMNFSAIHTPKPMKENSIFTLPISLFPNILNTIDYEILSRINPLIPRFLVK